jgi:ATP-dependent helicase/nuclease subunit A
MLVWAQRQADDVGPVRAARNIARDAAEDEYRRLLYVAMTRAAEKLVVCGTEGLQTRPQGCWYNLVHAALWDAASEEPADDSGDTVRRYRKEASGTEIAAQNAAASPAKEGEIAAGHVAQQEFDFVDKLPEWLGRKAPPAPAIPGLAPSRVHNSAAAPGHTSGTGRAAQSVQQAMERGRLIHRLLQALPDIPPEGREAAAQRYLARNGGAFSPDEQAAMLAQVMAVLDAPRFAPLFAPGSRGEVSIVGRIGGARGPTPIVNGQVDRLAITPDAVLIADFKTDRPVPRIVPPGYVIQLALYRAVLASLYPGRTVRAALLWTEGPELAELSTEELDRALASVTSP